MSWVIRPLRRGDGSDMCNLHRRAIMAISDEFYSSEERESWAIGLLPTQYVTPEGGYFDVVEADETVVAFCDHVAGEIKGLYVDPDWQGRGIGTALIRHAEARMVAAGTAVAKVQSALSAQRFYEKHGYWWIAPAEHRTRGGLIVQSAWLEKPIVTSR